MPNKSLKKETFEIALVLVNTKQLALFWGLTSQRVRDYVGDGMPIEGPDQYNLKKANDWRTARLLANEDLETEKIRLTKAQADDKEFELAIKRGEYKHVTEIESTVTKVLIGIRNKLLALPTKLSHRVFGAESRNEVNKTITKEVKEVLSELSSDRVATLFEGAGTAPRSKRKRVG